MEKEKLELTVSGFLLDTVIEKYHFAKSDRKLAEQVAKGLEEAVRGKAGFWYAPAGMEIIHGSAGTERKGSLQPERNGVMRSEVRVREDSVLAAALTLGDSVDALQEAYTEKGLLLECYLAEALAGELLLSAYVLFNEKIHKSTGLHVARYHFFGSREYPLQEMPAVLAGLTQEEVRCNEACCLVPKKSVVFLAEVTNDGRVRCEGICTGCGRADCPNACSTAQEKERLRWPD